MTNQEQSIGADQHSLPDDLYIPPDALEIILQSFSGPFDLLLYLIKKQNIDILDLELLEITKQYMAYMEVMKSIKFELASDYLVMAAMLAEIKSTMLLPAQHGDDDELEDDPRVRLIKQLQQYQLIKDLSAQLDKLAREERDYFVIRSIHSPEPIARDESPIMLADLILAYQAVDYRDQLIENYSLAEDTMSVEDKMSFLISKIRGLNNQSFALIVSAKEGREGVALSLLALLEMVKRSMLDIVQSEYNSDIHLVSIVDEKHSVSCV